MKKYEAIIYDIDGTLLNTLNMNMYPLMKIIKEETGEDWTFEQVLKFAAYPGMKVMEELGVKDQEKTYARWVQYVNEYEDKATLYKGFEEVLETFKNKKIKQAIVSSKLRDQYEIDIVSKGIDQYMSAVILEDDTTHHKPHPEWSGSQGPDLSARCFSQPSSWRKRRERNQSERCLSCMHRRGFLPE